MDDKRPTLKYPDAAIIEALNNITLCNPGSYTHRKGVETLAEILIETREAIRILAALVTQPETSASDKPASDYD